MAETTKIPALLQRCQGLTSNGTSGLYLLVNNSEFLACRCDQIYQYNCIEHWGNWAENRYEELLPTLLPALHFYSARFDYKPLYDPACNSFFLKLTNNLRARLRYSHFIWVNHLQDMFLHRHYMFGYPAAIDEQVIRDTYRRLAIKTWGYSDKMDVMIKECDNPPGHLRYMLGIDWKNNPEGKMPWADYANEACLRPNVCDGSAVYNLHRCQI